MKDQAREIIQQEATEQARRHRLREYLQHVLLRQLFERGVLREWIFHEGTAARILHDLARFSQDLDFHLPSARQDYNLEARLGHLVRDLEMQGYTVELTVRAGRAVVSSTVRFVGLLHELDLTPHENARLNIQIQVDTRPPEGFGVEQSAVDRYFPYLLTHHDRASFLAGKLHALLARGSVKGCDYTDLMFYLNR